MTALTSFHIVAALLRIASTVMAGSGKTLSPLAMLFLSLHCHVPGGDSVRGIIVGAVVPLRPDAGVSRSLTAKYAAWGGAAFSGVGLSVPACAPTLVNASNACTCCGVKISCVQKALAVVAVNFPGTLSLALSTDTPPNSVTHQTAPREHITPDRQPPWFSVAATVSISQAARVDVEDCLFHSLGGGAVDISWHALLDATTKSASLLQPGLSHGGSQPEGPPACGASSLGKWHAVPNVLKHVSESGVGGEVSEAASSKRESSVTQAGREAILACLRLVDVCSPADSGLCCSSGARCQQTCGFLLEARMQL